MTNQSRKTKKTKGLGAGILAFGVVFAAFSAIFHPHSIGGYLLAFALSGLFGAIVKIMGEGLDLTVKEQLPDSLKKMDRETGNPEVDELLQRGREMIIELRAERKLISDASLTSKMDEFEAQCAEIFRAVYEKPAKAPQIRKFMEYYLPTTLKLVKGYRTLTERNVTGQDALRARQRIDEALTVVLKGCRQMQDKLYRDDVLDITTDIDVLEQMLRRDGLTESELSMAATQAQRAAQINQAVDSRASQPQTAKPVTLELGTPGSGQATAQAPEQH